MKKILLVLLFIHVSIVAVKHLTDNDITQIYEAYVKPNYTPEYQLRYIPLPLKKNTIPGYPWENKDFPRVIALLEFERFVKQNDCYCCKKGLAINGIDPEWHYMKAEKLVCIEYEKNPVKYNLQTLELEEKDFDFVMLNQTLEHIYDPVCCLENIYNHMRVGGILYINVPANNIPHCTPFHHYTGYTPVGLGCVVRAAGFNILSIGQWGSITYLKKLFEINTWPDYRQFVDPGRNDMNCPIIAWIFAVKA